MRSRSVPNPAGIVEVHAAAKAATDSLYMAAGKDHGAATACAEAARKQILRELTREEALTSLHTLHDALAFYLAKAANHLMFFRPDQSEHALIIKGMVQAGLVLNMLLADIYTIRQSFSDDSLNLPKVE